MIIKLFLRAGGAAVLERMKSEKGNSREGGSGFWGLGEKLSEKLGEGLAGWGWLGIMGAVRLL